jgi:hypothetical protein
MSQLRVNSIRSETGTGAVDFPNGATVTGVITATTLQSSVTGDFTVARNLNVSGIATAGSLIVGSAISMSAAAIDGGVSVRILGKSLKIAGVATALDFNALSDVNLKDNVATVGGALDKVSELRGVSFNWKESGEPSYGVIAQELENVLPELVHGSDPKTVNYNGIIGVLIEAVKELKAEVDNLKK